MYERCGIKFHNNVRKISYKRGFVSVADENVTVKLENNVITRLFYHPPKTRHHGDKYMMKEVSKDGVKWLEYKLDKNGKKIRNLKWRPDDELPDR